MTDDPLMPDRERYYLYRVEMYLIHKYQPELVDELKISFSRARLRREGVLKQHDIILSKDALFNQIGQDLHDNAPWKPKNSSHRRTNPTRPGISDQYQRQFEEF